MDPITLIVTALVQGAAKAATDVVPDAYKCLRDLLRQRFAGKPAAEMVLEEHASDPQTYASPLRKQLEQAALAEDGEVLALARQLLEQLGPTAAAPTIEIGRGAKGIIGQTLSNATIVGDLN
ncbi:MAG: hypothetical protein ACKOPS_26165 [Cyanobium sp.]